MLRPPQLLPSIPTAQHEMIWDTQRGGEKPARGALSGTSPAALLTPTSQVLPTTSSLHEHELTTYALALPTPESNLQCDQGDNSLCYDSMNIPRFDVGSSWNTFYSRIRSTFADSRARLLQTQPPTSDTPRDGRHIDKVYPQNLPDPELMNEATAKFFTEVNVGTYVMDYDEFRTHLDNAYRLRLPLSNAVIMAVHLIFALCQDSEESFNYAGQYFNSTIAEGSLESVQTMMLLVLCHINRFERELAWSVLGCANRIAQSLGLQSSSPKWKIAASHDEEQRKTIWWSLYSLDAFVSSVLGREVTIQADQSFPPEIGLKVCPGIPPGYASFSSSLSRIYGEVAGLVYQQATTKTADVAAILTLLDRLKRWKNDLPEYLQPNCPTAPMYLRAINYLSLKYHHTVMLLTRPYLLQPLMNDRPYSQDWVNLAKVCEDANKESIFLLKETYRKNLLSKINYLDAYYILADCMILFLRVLKHPSEHLTRELEEAIPMVAVTQHIHFGTFGLRSFSALLSRLKLPQGDRSSLTLRDSDDLLTGNVSFDEMFNDFWDTAGLVGWESTMAE